MPGQKYHDATGTLSLMKNRAYRIGLEAPDYFAPKKKRMSNEDDFNLFFINCSDGPTWDDLQKVLENPHFGYSSDPDLKAFLDLQLDLENPFWRGYFTHLIGDRLAYQCGAVNMELFKKDCEEIGQDNAKKQLHHDWDVLNGVLDFMYQIELTEEIAALGIVQYSDGEAQYVDINLLIEQIEKIRKCATVDELIVLTE